MEKIFHIPVKGFLKWLVKKIQNGIAHFIGYEQVSAWKRVKQRRTLKPNNYTQLIEKRKKRIQGKKEHTYISPYEALLEKRKPKG